MQGRALTSRRHLHQGGAGWQRPPSLAGAGQALLGQPALPVVPELAQQRIPVIMSATTGKVVGSNAFSYQCRVADQLSCEPQERLLKVVVGLGRDIVVLQVLLAVEGDGLGLDLALLDVDLVTAENDGDVLADSDQITYQIVSV